MLQYSISTRKPLKERKRKLCEARRDKKALSDGKTFQKF